jgi:predicted short-subunit dehydrogenase-like oxidoreductase (DUF2520 family)
VPSTFSIIGAGRVGAYVSIGLQKAGFRPVSIFSSDGASAEQLAIGLSANSTEEVAWGDASLQSDRPFGEIIFVAVGDHNIAAVDRQLASLLPKENGHTVLHTAGAVSSRVFERLIEGGFPVGSFHPLQAFDNRPLHRIDSSVFIGLPIAVEGDRSAVGMASEVARRIGGNPFEITTEQKPTYHLAAVLSSNFYITLLGTAADVLPDGIPIEIMEPLAKRALQNAFDRIKKGNAGSAMTGPIARGDVHAVKAQLSLMESNSPKNLPLYLALSHATVATAYSEQLISDEQMTEMTSLLDAYSEDSRNQ